MAHSAKTDLAADRSGMKSEVQGTISRMSLMRLEFDDGISVVGPESVVLKAGAIDDVGTIIDIVCKFVDCHLGGGGGGGGDGCTTITIQNPDGSSTTIKQCPPKKIA